MIKVRYKIHPGENPFENTTIFIANESGITTLPRLTNSDLVSQLHINLGVYYYCDHTGPVEIGFNGQTYNWSYDVWYRVFDCLERGQICTLLLNSEWNNIHIVLTNLRCIKWLK